MKKIFRRLVNGLKLVWARLFDLLFGRLLVGYKRLTIEKIIKKTGHHPDSYPSPEVMARFAGYRYGANTAAFKGGREKIRSWQNGYEVVGAVAAVEKRTGRLILRGGVKCKRKSERAQSFLRLNQPLRDTAGKNVTESRRENLLRRIKNFMRSTKEHSTGNRDLSLS
jgi:hypothetical protein